MESIYNYIDYRVFLKDKIMRMKTSDAGFSYRSFNRRAGVSSSSFLKLVVDAKRNLGDEGIHKVAKGLELSKEEADYFENLVRFNQAKDHEEKDFYFSKLSQNKKFLHQAKPLAVAQYRLFSHWYSVAILALIGLEAKEKKDLCWLSRQIHPTVPKEELRRALAELIEMGLIIEEIPGQLRPSGRMFKTHEEVQSLALTNFHAQMCELAKRALLKEKPEDREFSALTITLSKEAFQRVKKEIQQFRSRLHSLLQEEDNEAPKEIVGHINFQLFQLNKPAA